ncbi:MAG: heme exporter protein CcmD [Pseudomonadota bacterium]
MNDLLAMGGYGVYVWSAYGITLAVFGLNIVMSYREMKRVRKIYQHQQTSPKLS